MPRLNNGQELYQYLDTSAAIKKYIIQATTPGDTTTAAAIAAGAVSVNVAAITNFTTGDPVFIIGDGGTELISAIGTPATTPMPWTNQKAAIAQSSGARFVEAQAITLGHVTEDGVDWGGSQELTAVKASTSRTPIAFIKQGAEITWGFTLWGYNNLNLQTAFGITEGETGAGTAGDPHQVLIGQTTIGSQGTVCFRFTGTRIDLKTVQIDMLGVTIEIAVQVKLGGSTPQGIRVQGKATDVIQRIW